MKNNLHKQLFIIGFLLAINSMAQNTCSAPQLFVSATYIEVPQVGTSGPTGNFYGCAGSTPSRPYFGLIKTCSTESMYLNIGNNTDSVSFVVWGPFADTSNLCNQLSASNLIFCDRKSGYQSSFGPFNILAKSTYLFMFTFENALIQDSLHVWYGGSYQPNDTCTICNGRVKALPKQQICVITNDSISGKNKIIWEETNSGDVHHYSIFRETNIVNNYAPIGIVPKSALSVYVDTTSNPAQRSFKYKVVSNDSCGNGVANNFIASSSHILASSGFGGIVNLIITPAYNTSWQTLPSVYIYRGPNLSSLSIIDSVPTTSGIFTYADLNPPVGTLFYQVEQRKATPCFPSKTTTGWYESVRSNLAGVVVTGIKNIEKEIEAIIFPNPNNGSCELRYSLNSDEAGELEILNLLGDKVFSVLLTTNSTSQKINLPNDIEDGFYTCRIFSGERYSSQKVIINRNK